MDHGDRDGGGEDSDRNGDFHAGVDIHARSVKCVTSFMLTEECALLELSASVCAKGRRTLRSGQDAL